MDCGKLLHHTTAASFTDFHACSDWKEALMDCVGNYSTTSLLYHLSRFPSPYCFHHIICLCLTANSYTCSNLAAECDASSAKFSDSKHSLTDKKLSWTVGNYSTTTLLPVLPISMHALTGKKLSWTVCETTPPHHSYTTYLAFHPHNYCTL